MLNCRELTRRVASDEYREARWPDRIGLWLHLAACRHCRRYVRQLKKIGSLGRERPPGAEAEPSGLERLEQDLIKRCEEKE